MRTQNDQEMKSALKKFFTSTKFLTMGLMYIGFAIFLLGMLLYRIFFADIISEEVYLSVVLMMALLCCGASGVFVVIRGEYPQRTPFQVVPRKVTIVFAGIWAGLCGVIIFLLLMCNFFFKC